MGKRKFVYSQITRNWGGIDIKREFDGKIESWLNQFEESDREVVLELLKHFKYYTSRRVNEKVIELYNKFAIEYGEDPYSITFIPVYKEYGVGFSDNFFNSFWFENELYDSAEKNIFNLLREGFDFQKIVILDDYSGSGKTIKRTIEHCIHNSEKCKDSLFYVLTLEMSSTAKARLDRFAHENSLNIKIVYLHFVNKVFENREIFGDADLSKKKLNYIDICLKHNVLPTNHLGFDKTEGLLSFEYNTPNNTLGLFWHEGDDFFAIFKRYKKKSTTLTLMHKEAKQRQNERYKKIIKKHSKDDKFTYLMIYFLNTGMNFNYQEACKKMGMTEEQMDKAIECLFSEGYLALSAGKPKPTDKLKQIVKITKIAEIMEEGKGAYKEQFELKPSYIPRDFEKTFRGY